MRPIRLLTALALVSACAAAAFHPQPLEGQDITVRDSPSIIDDTLKAEAPPTSNVRESGKDNEQDERAEAKVEARTDGSASSGPIAPHVVRRLSVKTGSKDDVGRFARRTSKRDFSGLWDAGASSVELPRYRLSMLYSHEALDNKPAHPPIPAKYLGHVNWKLYNATCSTLGLDFAVLNRKQKFRLAYCADAVAAKSETIKSSHAKPNIVKRTGSETTTPTPAEIKAALDAKVEATVALCPDMRSFCPETGCKIIHAK